MGPLSRSGHLRRMRRQSFCPECPHCRPDAASDMSSLTDELKTLVAEMEDRIREGRPGDKETKESNE